MHKRNAVWWCFMALLLAATSVRAQNPIKERDTRLQVTPPPLLPHAGKSGSRPNPDARILRQEQQNKAAREQKMEVAEAYRKKRSEMGRFTWQVDETRPVSRVVISLGEQKLRIYQEEKEVASSYVSTGREGYSTPKGRYGVRQKSPQHRSSLYGQIVDIKTGKVVNSNAKASDKIPPGARYEPSPMPFFLRLTDCGVGLHEGFLPGFAASHGCIRLPNGMAEKLFHIATLGTIVEVVP